MMSEQTIIINISGKEKEVLDELAAKKEMSITAILRQALRLYQLVDHRLSNGERMSFSGDNNRAIKCRWEVDQKPVEEPGLNSMKILGSIPIPSELEAGKISIKSTERGFLRGEFCDRYNSKCSIQKSSLANQDCIWLGCDCNSEGTPGMRMHLTRETVAELIPLLQRFIDTGDL